MQWLAGQPESVLRRRIGSNAAVACLDELWRESQKRTSPTVSLYGNVPARQPTARSVRQAVGKRIISEEADGGYRGMAVLLVMISTSSWMMGKLPVNGERHWST